MRCITSAGHVRGFACVTTKLVQAACQQHGTLPTASDALGRALTCGAMMGAQLKGRERVALKFEGSGPLKKILIESNARGEVRGYVGVPDVDVPLRDNAPDIPSAIGKAGFLTVTKDLGLKEPYRGIVQLYSSEIATDLAYYLTESEQIPSAVGVGVFVGPDREIGAAGGFLIQAMPGAHTGAASATDARGEETAAQQRAIDQVVEQIQQMPPLTELLIQGQTPEQLLDRIFQDMTYEVLDSQPLAYRCSCSKARIEQALVSIGVDELNGLIQEGGAEVVCEFCRTPYTFTAEELTQLVRTIQ